MDSCEPSAVMKGGRFPEVLNSYQLLKFVSASKNLFTYFINTYNSIYYCYAWTNVPRRCQDNVNVGLMETELEGIELIHLGTVVQPC